MAVEGVVAEAAAVGLLLPLAEPVAVEEAESRVVCAVMG